VSYPPKESILICFPRYDGVLREDRKAIAWVSDGEYILLLGYDIKRNELKFLRLSTNSVIWLSPDVARYNFAPNVTAELLKYLNDVLKKVEKGK
jgi:hypothetical protein